MGGMIAQELALAYPARVIRLVLGCTQATSATAVRPAREVGRAFALETDDWGERMRVLAPYAFAPEVDPRLLAGFIAKKSGDAQPAQGYRGQIAASQAHDALARLPALDLPTLILTGDADQIIPAVNSEHLHDAIPGAQLETLPGAGHLFFIEQPERTPALLRAFLTGSRLV
jgi:pimeloyl-ACP methyl ester carboxylesterase